MRILHVQLWPSYVTASLRNGIRRFALFVATCRSDAHRMSMASDAQYGHLRHDLQTQALFDVLNTMEHSEGYVSVLNEAL